jgi:hypothetical protein
MMTMVRIMVAVCVCSEACICASVHNDFSECGIANISSKLMVTLIVSPRKNVAMRVFHIGLVLHSVETQQEKAKPQNTIHVRDTACISTRPHVHALGCTA